MVESLLGGEINVFGKMGFANQGEVVIASSDLYSRGIFSHSLCNTLDSVSDTWKDA